MKMKLFKLRNITTGLYSRGGDSPSFNIEGKSWKKINHVTSHITMVTKNRSSSVYDNCEIVEFEYEPVEISSTPVKEMIESKVKSRRDLQERYKKSREREIYKDAKAFVEEYEKNVGQ